MDSQSAAILRTLVLMLCVSLAVHFWRAHPDIALTLGLCVGVLVGQAIPPRLSLRRLAMTISAVLVFGAVLGAFHR